MRPFLRWAGGKRWLVEADNIRLPRAGRYVEPFLGGGAVFFSQNARTALLSDLNPFLINSYRWMKISPLELFELVQRHFNSHTNEYYYSVRSKLSAETIGDASDFIYLNRACFNGLFRVNLSGQFNVPIGSKLFRLQSKDEFINWAAHLEKTEILHSDFEAIIDQCGEGDFLFLDPPYTVKHNANGFIEYNEKIFSWEDQVRLAEALKRAAERGSSFLLTNADHDTVRSLYCDEWSFSSEERGSEMASKTAYRGRTTELMVASSDDILRPSRLL